MDDQGSQRGSHTQRQPVYHKYRAAGSPGATRPPAASVARRSSVAARRRKGRLRLAVFVACVVLVAGGATAWAVLRSDDGGAGAGGAGSGAGSGQSGSGGQTASPAAVAEQSVSPSPTEAPTPADPIVIEVGWVGDTTPGSRYGTPPDSGRALFANVRAQLSKPDLMIANLEGTYSTATSSKCGSNTTNCFAFQAPPAYAKALAWAGVDMVNVANNHSYDFLEAGFQQTMQALDAAKIEYTGVPGHVPVVDVDGVRVAALGFSPYTYNPSINDIPTAKKMVAQAAKKADLVVVLMHAGAEGADLIHTPTGTEYAFGENRGDSRAFSHACIDAGADLVLGSGPHVIRGIERYKDRLIAYSLGNFGGWGNFGTGGNLSLSGLLKVRIDQTGRIRGGQWVSIYLDDPGVPRVDTSHTAARLVRQLSAADFSKTYTLDAQGRFKGD